MLWAQINLVPYTSCMVDWSEQFACNIDPNRWTIIYFLIANNKPFAIYLGHVLVMCLCICMSLFFKWNIWNINGKNLSRWRYFSQIISGLNRYQQSQSFISDFLISYFNWYFFGRNSLQEELPFDATICHCLTIH